jgi:hypothetical protein
MTPKEANLSRQEMFDIMVRHLRQQKHQALAMEGGACVYLTESGLKCAVGALIPDGHPAQADSGGVSSTWGRYPDLFHEADVAFLGECQRRLHDDSQPSDWTEDYFERMVQYIAEKYDLEVPE